MKPLVLKYKIKNNIRLDMSWLSTIDTSNLSLVKNKNILLGNKRYKVSELFTVSGEKPEKAIKPEIVAEYLQASTKGQLKFVVGPLQREWDEMEETVEKFRSAGVDWPVWIMPTGAREEEQTAGAGKVAEEAFKRGYNVAARVHVYLFGNAIGT